MKSVAKSRILRKKKEATFCFIITCGMSIKSNTPHSKIHTDFSTDIFSKLSFLNTIFIIAIFKGILLLYASVISVSTRAAILMFRVWHSLISSLTPATRKDLRSPQSCGIFNYKFQTLILFFY